MPKTKVIKISNNPEKVASGADSLTEPEKKRPIKQQHKKVGSRFSAAFLKKISLPKFSKVSVSQDKDLTATNPGRLGLFSRRLKRSDAKSRWPRFVTSLFVLLIATVGLLLVAELALARTLTRFAYTDSTSAGANPPTLCNEEQLNALKEKISSDLSKKWYLRGKEFIGNSPLEAQIVVDTKDLGCTPQTLVAKAAIANSEISSETKLKNASVNRISFNIDALAEGTHTLNLEVSVEESKQVMATSQLTFYVSKPVYVAWTLDWEGYNFSDNYLNQINQLSQRSQRVPITHFFNPLYSISGGTLQRRGAYFANWIKGRQEAYGDEVGLHIHMFYEIATAAGVTPRTDPKWNARSNGSDVPLTTYDLDEQRKIIAWSKANLQQQGFTNLKSFRAGGWFANLDTLKALEESGFVIESSGRTAYSLGGGISGPWRLDAAAQPYYPCRNNQNAGCSGANAFTIMQMPNNGGESFRFSTTQLIDRFRGVYNGQPQAKHQVLTVLSHPEWFNVDYPKINSLFGTIDGHLYAEDKGPVIYATLETIHEALKIN